MSAAKDFKWENTFAVLMECPNPRTFQLVKVMPTPLEERLECISKSSDMNIVKPLKHTDNSIKENNIKNTLLRTFANKVHFRLEQT